MRIFWVFAILCILCPISADAYTRKSGGTIAECSKYNESSSMYRKCIKAYDREYYNYYNSNNMNNAGNTYMPSKGTYGSNLNRKMNEDKRNQSDNTKYYLDVRSVPANAGYVPKEGRYLSPR